MKVEILKLIDKHNLQAKDIMFHITIKDNSEDSNFMEKFETYTLEEALEEIQILNYCFMEEKHRIDIYIY